MKTIFKGYGGSFAYGTFIEGKSDLDEKEVYIQSLPSLLTNYVEQYENHKDHVAYEVKRFLELLQSANPTMLEILFLPDDCILLETDEFKLIKEHRQVFVTRQLKYSLGGYVQQQIKKAQGLNKKQNWERAKFEKRKQPIDFCYVVLDSTNSIEGIKQGVYPLSDWLRKNNINEDNVYVNKLNHTREGYQLYLGNKGGIVAEDSTRLRTPSSEEGQLPIATVLYNSDGYTDHCKEFKAYQTWLKERNVERYVDFKEHGQSYDGKNLLHCRRLLDMAIEIARNGEFNVRRNNREELLAIRKGEVSLEDIIKKVQEDLLLVDKLFEDSKLPNRVEKGIIDILLLKARGLK